MKIAGFVDAGGVDAALDNLLGTARVSLLRSGLVAAGKVIRDEAEARAPVHSRRLKSAMYVAYSPERSFGGQQAYAVSWRKGLFGGARHGHLIEFGHWRVNVLAQGANGQWFATTERLPQPKWVPAQPFLRPALDSAGGRAVAAATERMRVRLPELLAEAGK